MRVKDVVNLVGNNNSKLYAKAVELLKQTPYDQVVDAIIEKKCNYICLLDIVPHGDEETVSKLLKATDSEFYTLSRLCLHGDERVIQHIIQHHVYNFVDALQGLSIVARKTDHPQALEFLWHHFNRTEHLDTQRETASAIVSVATEKNQHIISLLNTKSKNRYALVALGLLGHKDKKLIRKLVEVALQDEMQDELPFGEAILKIMKPDDKIYVAKKILPPLLGYQSTDFNRENAKNILQACFMHDSYAIHYLLSNVDINAKKAVPLLAKIVKKDDVDVLPVIITFLESPSEESQSVIKNLPDILSRRDSSHGYEKILGVPSGRFFEDVSIIVHGKRVVYNDLHKLCSRFSQQLTGMLHAWCISTLLQKPFVGKNTKKRRKKDDLTGSKLVVNVIRKLTFKDNVVIRDFIKTTTNEEMKNDLLDAFVQYKSKKNQSFSESEDESDSVSIVKMLRSYDPIHDFDPIWDVYLSNSVLETFLAKGDPNEAIPITLEEKLKHTTLPALQFLHLYCLPNSPRPPLI
jgi:hypothetical protein